MCGIAGQFNFNNKSINNSEIELMGDAIPHRGPDYTGYYFENNLGFCHKRLKIIDLSESANQPMISEDGNIVLIFNGEIYNYKEIRKELEALNFKFKTQSDTEVLLKAYQAFGTSCFDRFNGMFAFVIWDKLSNRFIAARDRIGIKPFYYFVKEGQFIFGSEIKSIIANPSVEKKPNWDSIKNFLIFEHPINQNSWFENIQALPPGNMLEVRNGQVIITPFWEIKYNINYDRSFNSFKEELKETIIDAVRINWQSDVPVGAHLSGGVDSSTIVSIATKILKNELHTFSSAFDLGKEYDERAEIDLMQKTFKTKHHQISISSDDVLENLDKIIWHLDEPVIGPAILPMYKISQLVKREGIVVVNGGQGVDEMFGGYPPYFALAVKNFSEAIGKNNFSIHELFYAAIYLNKGGAFSRFKDKFLKKKNNSVINWLKVKDVGSYRIYEVDKLRSEMKDVGEFEKSSYVHLKYYLAGLLQQEDRLSMASSIESRVPLIDNRIIDLSMQIPSWHKIKNGMSKAVFREAMRGIVPDEILNNRIKRGYPTPISVWFAGPLYDWAHQFLSEESWHIDCLVNRNELLKLLEFQKNNPMMNLSNPLWKAFVTEKWFRLNFGSIIK